MRGTIKEPLYLMCFLGGNREQCEVNYSEGSGDGQSKALFSSSFK